MILSPARRRLFLAIAIGVVAAMVIVVPVLVLIEVATVNSNTSATQSAVMQHSDELAAVQVTSTEAKDAAEASAATLALLLRLQAQSKHPGEVSQSIEFQICRAVDGIDHALRIRPGCRIP